MSEHAATELEDDADIKQGEFAPVSEAGQEEAPARSRKAWAPEADDEIAALLRRVALQPWLVGGRADSDIAAVRRNESALRDACSRLGWPLVVEGDLVRLRKSPPPRPEQWAVHGPKPPVCSWFFLLVAAGESMAPRVGIGQLVVAARSAAAEAGLPTTGDIGERRAIVAAVKLLQDRGVVEALDGDLDGYAQDESVPVLLAIHHTWLTHVVANSGTLDPSLEPERWLEQAHREPDPARRMRRRLIDDTCVHAADLDQAETQWLSQRVRGDDGAPLAAAFGLALERRSEGAAFVVPEGAFKHPRDLGPLPFPVPGTVAHAALLLCDHAALHGATDAEPGPGWRTLTAEQVREALARFAADNTRGRAGWSQEYVEDVDLLARAVGDRLAGINLLRIAEPEQLIQLGARLPRPAWHFAPTSGRWAESGSAKPKKPRRTKVSPLPVVDPLDLDLDLDSDEDPE